jgi:nucleotide-binding universal stress UspA family protein
MGLGEALPEDALQELQVVGQKLNEIVEEIKKEHPAVEATEVIGNVCSHIVDLAKLLKSDLIVVSTHNYPWFKRLMTGSDAEKIARHAPCPILIVHQREHDFVD